jgi:hypothetical protein
MDESYRCFRCDKVESLKDQHLYHTLRVDTGSYPDDPCPLPPIFRICDSCIEAFYAWLFLCKKPKQQWPPMKLYPDGWGKDGECLQPKT